MTDLCNAQAPTPAAMDPVTSDEVLHVVALGVHRLRARAAAAEAELAERYGELAEKHRYIQHLERQNKERRDLISELEQQAWNLRRDATRHKDKVAELTQVAGRREDQINELIAELVAARETAKTKSAALALGHVIGRLTELGYGAAWTFVGTLTEDGITQPSTDEAPAAASEADQ